MKSPPGLPMIPKPLEEQYQYLKSGKETRPGTRSTNNTSGQGDKWDGETKGEIELQLTHLQEPRKIIRQTMGRKREIKWKKRKTKRNSSSESAENVPGTLYLHYYCNIVIWNMTFTCMCIISSIYKCISIYNTTYIILSS